MAEHVPHSRPLEPRATSAADHWALRIIEPGRPDRLAEWRDRPADATEASANPPRGCLLRVNCPPTAQSDGSGHACTLYRGANGPRVRAWSETVLLNGHTIVDAEIQPGDRLALGNLEFELVELPLHAPSDNSGIIESPLEATTEPECVEPNAGPLVVSTCRAVDVIPPREHDDSEESVEDHLERLLKRVCGEDAARDFARQRERNHPQIAQAISAHDETSPSEFAAALAIGRSGDLSDESSGELSGEFSGEFSGDAESFDAARTRPERRDRHSVIASGDDQTRTSGTPASRTTHAAAPAAPLRPRDVQADWSGLRDLANQSARAAIETHQLKGVARSARSRLSAAVLFAVSGTVGLYAIPGDQWLPLLGVLAAYGATVLWLLKTLRGSRTFRGAGGR